MRQYAAVFIFAAAAFSAGYYFPHSGAQSAESVRPLISPGIGGDVVALIASANSTLDVEVYQFSYVPLQQALVDAHARGVNVRVILEPRLSGDDNLDTAEFLVKNGVPVHWASLSFANTHSKLAVVDGKEVLIGSPNWSNSAMNRNRETAVLVSSPALASEFSSMFEKDWASGKAA